MKRFGWFRPKVKMHADEELSQQSVLELLARLQDNPRPDDEVPRHIPTRRADDE